MWIAVETFDPKNVVYQRPTGMSDMLPVSPIEVREDSKSLRDRIIALEPD